MLALEFVRHLPQHRRVRGKQEHRPVERARGSGMPGHDQEGGLTTSSSSVNVASCSSSAAVSLTIRDLPEATRDMLRQRAEARRQSLNSYIVDLLEREAGLPTMSEWADMVESRARLAGFSDAAVEAVRELRDAVEPVGHRRVGDRRVPGVR